MDAMLVRRVAHAKPDVVLFLGGDADLATLTKQADALRWAPRLLLLGALAPRAAAEAPARFDGRIFLAYPVIPSDEKAAAVAELARLRASAGAAGRNRAAQVSAYTAAVLMGEALRRAGKALSRDRLVQSLEALYEFDPGLAPPLTYGPSRRIGALGGYVVAVDLGKRSFRPVSGWIPLE
jgi:ABC-type branched-subunit amino acid transport system substrate-binding protein